MISRLREISADIAGDQAGRVFAGTVDIAAVRLHYGLDKDATETRKQDEHRHNQADAWVH